MIRFSTPGSARAVTPLWRMPLALLVCWFAVLAQVHPATIGNARAQGISQLELLGNLTAIDRATTVKRNDDSSADGDSDPPAAVGAPESATRLHLDATAALTEFDVHRFSRPVFWLPQAPRAPPV